MVLLLNYYLNLFLGCIDFNDNKICIASSYGSLNFVSLIFLQIYYYLNLIMGPLASIHLNSIFSQVSTLKWFAPIGIRSLQVVNEAMLI